ncbi:uncharacterized protein LOC128172863 isoform X3 [Crassostrea angulata]|uniref:uncharacterized protein LOC128172863 isoform X3 n=1 Tax=Magallana angulata TaxID=2784310 RepID=UPI0022B0DEA7|nr:uncharacterized protein LOC128172863 isoform X3 [Crassostrea angulata]
MAMFKPKMNPEYSHVHSENFDLFLSPNVGRLKDIFNKYLDEWDFKTKINLADFGTNDGKNIFPFLRIMIELIRQRSASCEICVTLNDQPTNDFSALVKNAEDFKKEMKDDFLAVHTIPGSAYHRCLPDETIDIGTCSLMLHFLSEYVVLENALMFVPGLLVSDEETTKVRSLAAEDLKTFIRARLTEMKRGAIFFVNIPTDPLEINEMCSSTFYQLYQRNVISKEELRNTFVPVNNARTETDIKTAFVEIGKDNGVEFLHFTHRRVKMYQNKDLLKCVRAWISPSLMAGLCQTRSINDAADVCELFFHDLRSRLSDMKCVDYNIYEVIFQKL